MRKIANNIIIKTEIKTDFITNNYGMPTEETYEYKEYDVVNEEGFVLETGRYEDETITVQDILDRTGIAFGISTWVY